MTEIQPLKASGEIICCKFQISGGSQLLFRWRNIRKIK